MSKPKEKSRLSANQTGTSNNRFRDSLTGTLTTGIGAVVILLAFTIIPGGTLQLAVVSLGGLLAAGGAK
jgi:hypothetical protein